MIKFILRAGGSREKENRNSCSVPRSSASWIFPLSEPGACSSKRKVISSLLRCPRQCVVPGTVSYSYCIKKVTFLTRAYLLDFFMTINDKLALICQTEHWWEHWSDFLIDYTCTNHKHQRLNSSNSVSDTRQATCTKSKAEMVNQE